MAGKQLSATDVVPLMRHLADVAALKSSPRAQRRHLMHGLNALLSPGVKLALGKDGQGVKLRHESRLKLDAKLLHLAEFAIDETQRLISRGHIAGMSAKGKDSGSAPMSAALPPRLVQVLELVLLGRSPKAIARELRLSLWTVRDHLQRLYKHFGVAGRDELMARHLER